MFYARSNEVLLVHMECKGRLSSPLKELDCAFFSVDSVTREGFLSRGGPTFPEEGQSFLVAGLSRNPYSIEE